MQFTTPLTSSGKLASLAFLLLGLHPSVVNSVTFDCKQVVIGDVKLDLSPLTGPHSVSMLQRTPTAIKNTTFTLDICKPLYKSGDKPKSAECPNGSRGKMGRLFEQIQDHTTHDIIQFARSSDSTILKSWTSRYLKMYGQSLANSYTKDEGGSSTRNTHACATPPPMLTQIAKAYDWSSMAGYTRA